MPIVQLPTICKSCPTAESFQQELSGYEFFTAYATNVPRLHEVSAEARTLTFEDLVASRSAWPLSRELDRNRYPGDFAAFWQQLQWNHCRYLATRIPGGGTQLFYRRRVERLLDPQLQRSFTTWTQAHPYISINSTRIPTSSDLPERIAWAVAAFGKGRCVPSQGDVHERNIFTSGDFVDFEAGGWNLLVTDIATTMWHTLFAGSWFGPRYAAWATPADMQRLELKPPQLLRAGGAVIFKLNRARRRCLHDYVTYYVEPFQLTADETERLCQAIAFRLLSMFDPPSMTRSDQFMAYSLATFFAYPPLDLPGKLAVLLG